MPSARRSTERPSTGDHRPALLPLAAAVAVIASAVFVVQFVSGRPVVGIGGLVALVAPAVLLALAMPPRLLRRPPTVLLVLAVTLAFTVTLGIVAALTPRGLDAGTIAGLGQVGLTIAFAAWLVRSRQLLGHADSRGVLLAPTAISVNARMPRRRSIALVAAGVAMAGAGLFVARTAAEGQVYPAYLVLWSGPSASSAEPVVGVANASGATLDCALELTRPGATPVRWSIAAIENGAAWEDPLPLAADDQRAAWVLHLSCADPGGATLERQLRIDPPA